MRIALAQINPVVGDLTGNTSKIEAVLSDLAGATPDLVVFPELCLTGYPPRDLLERDWFIGRAETALGKVLEISRARPEVGMIVGLPLASDRRSGKGVYNSAVLIRGGSILAKRHKSLLPTYDVFDEARYFDPAQSTAPVPFGNDLLGITICEDAWNEPGLRRGRPYASDPVADLASQGATIFVNISASPFHVGKDEIRYRLIRKHAETHRVPFIMVNQVGGNDELIFDGRSMYVGPDGSLVEYLPSFEESVRIVDTTRAHAPKEFVPEGSVESIYRALLLGLRDYVQKCGFRRVVVGLSGGIDSAVTSCLAAAALDPENVLGVTMPSTYSSRGSVDDSRELADNLGIKFDEIGIDGIYSSYLSTLEDVLGDSGVDIAKENIQARVRGNILMTISNKLGHLVLSTGNKSELAVGYCTMYGDMTGGLAVLSDVPKTMVYELAAYINRDREVIPPAIIEKPPSAELRPDQRDDDTLPDYATLDRILNLYLDEGRSLEEMAREGIDQDTATWVLAAVNGSEYKRRQAAPGLKVTSKAFGMGRRMPIAARYEP